MRDDGRAMRDEACVLGDERRAMKDAGHAIGAAPMLLLAVAACLAVAGCGGASRSTPKAGGSLVARGAVLYQDDGCSGCHSLNGTRMVGPSWKGLAGSTVELTSGRTAIANNSYLIQHITEPNSLTVRGYPHGVMAQAIGVWQLKRHPAEVRALVAFIDSLGAKRARSVGQ